MVKIGPRILVAAVLLAAASGCQSSYKVAEAGYAESARPAFKADIRVYIATPTDAVYKKEGVARSGRHTAEALWDAFRLFTKTVFIGKTNETFDEALAEARKTRSDYMIYPVILNWEDHTTEWTGVRDRLEVRFEVYKVESGQRVYAREVKARSSWMSDGEDTPDNLLKTPSEQFVRTIYHETVIPSAFP